VRAVLFWTLFVVVVFDTHKTRYFCRFAHIILPLLCFVLAGARKDVSLLSNYFFSLFVLSKTRPLSLL
jgi:hypothetical protein